MVIIEIEDIREIEINFDLKAYSNFNFTIGVGAATVKAVNGSISTDSSVNAYKCNGLTFSNGTSALVPNEKLFVCIESASPDVEINKVDSMVSTCCPQLPLLILYSCHNMYVLM